MKQNILSLAVAVVLAGAAQNSFATIEPALNAAALATLAATTPSVSNPANNVVVLSVAGAAALDKGIAVLLAKDILKAGTLTIYKDTYATPSNPTGTADNTNWGGRWTTYVGQTGTTNQAGTYTLPASLQNKTLVFNKRNNGGSAYAILPLVTNPVNGNVAFPVNFLDPALSIAAAQAGAGSVYNGGTDSATGAPVYGVYASEPVSSAGGGTVAGTNTFAVIPDGGVSDTNPDLYYGANQGVDFGTPVQASDVATLNVKPGIALTYGVPVSLGLFNALQAAQGLTVSNDYGSAVGLSDRTPTLSHNTIAALEAGKIQTWSQLSFNGNSLSVPAGVDPQVWVLERAGGAGNLAVHNARFLNLPGPNNVTAPAVTPALDARTAGGPSVALIGENASEESGFDDLATGSVSVYDLNGNAVNTAGHKAWAIGQVTVDKNASITGTYAHQYRFVKVDGYTPSLQNVYDGNYTLWGQSAWIWPKSQVTTDSAAVWTDKVAALSYIATQGTLASVVVKGNVNQSFAAQEVISGTTYGNAAYLGLPVYNGVPTALDFTKPVIPFQYPNGDNTQVALPYTSTQDLTWH